MARVDSESKDAIGTIVLNHAEKRNALSKVLIDEVVAALEGFRREKLRCVVLRGGGQQGVERWTRRQRVARGRPRSAGLERLAARIGARLQEFPAPIIALIEGSVWGGGCEVAMACDILVATPEVTFAITPAKLGLPYNLSGVLTLMNAIPLPVAKEMLFTAQPIPATQALNLGVINYIRPAAEIDEFVYNIARKIVANAPLSVAVMKEELRLLASASSITPELFERMQGLRRVVYDSHDYQEGLRAIREKRKPNFAGD